MFHKWWFFTFFSFNTPLFSGVEGQLHTIPLPFNYFPEFASTLQPHTFAFICRRFCIVFLLHYSIYPLQILYYSVLWRHKIWWRLVHKLFGRLCSTEQERKHRTAKTATCPPLPKKKRMLLAKPKIQLTNDKLLTTQQRLHQLLMKFRKRIYTCLPPLYKREICFISLF